MFCKNCGTEYNTNAKFCKNCGKHISEEASEPATVPENKPGIIPTPPTPPVPPVSPFSQPAAKYSKKPRILTKIMCVSLAAMLGINGYCAYNLLSRKPKNIESNAASLKLSDEKDKTSKKERIDKQAERRKEGYINHIPDKKQGLDNVVVDEEDAIELLETIQSNLGIVNAKKEFYCCRKEKIKEKTVYYMQQKYNNYDVKDGIIVLTVDNNGNLLHSNGYYQNTTDFNFGDTISSSDAYNTVKKYVKKTYQLELDDINYHTDGLKIYTFHDRSYLAYSYDTGTNVILVNAENGDVISDTSKLCATDVVTGDDTVFPKLDGQQEKQTLDYYKFYSDECSLKDTERNIFIYNPTDNYSKIFSHFSDEKFSVEEFEFDIKEKEVPAAEGEETPVDDDKEPEYVLGDNPPQKSAVDALANLERIYDFYYDVIGISGIQNDINFQLPVYMNINGETANGDFVDNAAMVGDDCILVTERSSSTDPEYSYALDVMGHEWTHGVVYHANPSPLSSVCDEYDSKGNLTYNRQKSVQLAINEGLADIMGEMAEDWADGALDNSCNWQIENIRDAASPTGGSLTDARSFVDGTTDCHDGATIFSHIAYSVCNGDNAVPTSVLAPIVYDSFMYCNNHTDFIQYRSIFEELAVEANQNGEINDAQLEKIIDTFDEAGIDNLYQYDLTPGAALNVYDINVELYDNYNIRIYKGNVNGELVVDENVTSEQYTLPEEIVPGIYYAELTDNNSEADAEATVKKITIIVNDNSITSDPVVTYLEEDDVYTNFGAESKEVVLCIDRSGSMDGEPIIETRLSAVNFAESILQLNPAASISIVAFDSTASEVIANSNDINSIISAINSISPLGGTNLYEGIEISDSLFDYNDNNEKVLVIMSDGLPNEGKSSPEELKAFCDEISSKNVEIFSLGFFHNLSGSELKSAIELMRGLTIYQNYTNVSKPSDLEIAFDMLAMQSSGEQFYEASIACPVNVEVSYNGETLSSDPENLNVKTSFGYLFFEPETEENADGDITMELSESSNENDNMKKILKLKEGLDYEIKITGTDSGKMTYTISYPNEDGDYDDVRKFENIKITKNTVISTKTNESGKNILYVDNDNDGIIDKEYSASRNGKGKETEVNYKLYIIITVSSVVGLYLIFIILRAVFRAKKNKARICRKCKKAVDTASAVCLNCNTLYIKRRLIIPEKVVRKPQKKAAVITKLIITAVSLGLCCSGILIFNSAPSKAYKYITENQYTPAEGLYRKQVEDSDISTNYFDFLTNHFLGKVEKELDKEKMSQESAYSICTFVKSLELDNSSEKADEILGQISE